MKIIISPAKKMKMIDDINIECTTPMFLSKTTELLNHIKSLDYSELKSYLKCSDTIAQTTYDQFQNMSLEENTTPSHTELFWHTISIYGTPCIYR